MAANELFFVIPTYRLREVGETIEHYDEHFWRNGHSVPMIVFDDSSPVNQEKYYPLLEQTKTHNELYYVGPREKEQFLAYLNGRLRDKRLEGLVKNLFRPSYGGNRNYTLMYTLGGLMISADDDMRPYTLMEHSPESLNPDEVCRGRLHRVGHNGYSRKSFDICTAFLDVLGKSASEVPDNYERGELLVDTAMDLETNATQGLAQENSLLLQRGPLADNAVVRMAQTFRSGTNDIDAIDFVEMFLDDESQTNPDDLNALYVLVNFRPVVTKKNWRMDCGVAGYDNTFGLRRSSTRSASCTAGPWSPRRPRPGPSVPRRCGCSRPICTRRSTASSRTSSSRTCCASWTMSSASSRARSSCGRRSWRSAISRRAVRGCRRCGSTIRRSKP
jgi:hypothetical protein